MDWDELVQEFKELNVYLSELCLNGHKVKDAGNLWIQFSDKFRAFEKKLLQDYSKQSESPVPDKVDAKEYILSSAIHYDDGKQYPNQLKNISSGICVSGFGHADCIGVLAQIFPDLSYKENYTEGFLTSNRRYVNRKEAGRLAIEAGQITELKYFGGKELDSSELYNSNPPKSTQQSDAVEFMKWVQNKGYRIYGWDDGQIERIYQLFKKSKQ